MKRKDYDSEFAAICDIARWDERIIKGNKPSFFIATTTTPDGSSRNMRGKRQKISACTRKGENS